MPPKKIILIRHGETEWALNGKHTGWTDIPLTPNGEKQSSLLPLLLQEFHIAKALVSPLKRAKDTFSLSGLSVEHEFDKDLYEWNYGKYEGMTSQEIQKENPGWNLFIQGAPGGESLEDAQIRAKKVVQKTLSIAGDVALFSSGHILRVIAIELLGLPIVVGKHLTLFPSSVSILTYERNVPVIALWNKTNHP